MIWTEHWWTRILQTSYRIKKAIQSLIQTDNKIEFNPKERFNRASLKMLFPDLNEEKYDAITQRKEEIYQENLSKTKLINPVVEILIKYYKTNKTVLVTNSREERALMVLNYHNLTDKFSNKFFRNTSDNGHRINKYKNAISSLSLSVQTVIIFENERPEIEDAILAGIPTKNMINF